MPSRANDVPSARQSEGSSKERPRSAASQPRQAPPQVAGRSDRTRVALSGYHYPHQDLARVCAPPSSRGQSDPVPAAASPSPSPEAFWPFSEEGETNAPPRPSQEGRSRLGMAGGSASHSTIHKLSASSWSGHSSLGVHGTDVEHIRRPDQKLAAEINFMGRCHDASICCSVLPSFLAPRVGEETLESHAQP